jgi:glycerol-3-phosphate cytidylyltransferase
VDEVIVQSHRDKIKQYHDVGYDVMFVGDDWKGSDIFNTVEKQLEERGASIEYFDYTKNISSTHFTKILQEIYDSEKLVK